MQGVAELRERGCASDGRLALALLRNAQPYSDLLVRFPASHIVGMPTQQGTRVGVVCEFTCARTLYILPGSEGSVVSGIATTGANQADVTTCWTKQMGRDEMYGLRSTPYILRTINATKGRYPVAKYCILPMFPTDGRCPQQTYGLLRTASRKINKKIKK